MTEEAEDELLERLGEVFNDPLIVHMHRLMKSLKGATVDECRLVQMFAKKLMGEGRTEHGPLDIATETRSVHELLHEAIDEGLDAVSYMLMAKLKGEHDANQ